MKINEKTKHKFHCNEGKVIRIIFFNSLVLIAARKEKINFQKSFKNVHGRFYLQILNDLKKEFNVLKLSKICITFIAHFTSTPEKKL